MDWELILALGAAAWFVWQAFESSPAQIALPDYSAPGASMTPTGNISAAGLAQLAANAGFQGSDLITAVAVALAESGGNPVVVGDQNITPGGSIGLWQINLRWHPEYTAAMLTDPQTNADAAFAIYQAAGNSFTPWSTFKSGAYTTYLNNAQDGANVVA